MTRRLIPWVPSEHGGPLGRHVDHDPRSRSFAVSAPRVTVLKLVAHSRHSAIFDQGQLGSCTGNALEGALASDPLHKRYERHTEKKAVALYSLGTTLDDSPGQYPPTDTGSSGLAVCKAAVTLGRLVRYEHAFTIDQALDALQLGPVITGIDWYEGFDQPDLLGRVKIAGQIRGGHEIVVRGYYPDYHGDGPSILLDNSWGSGWGLRGRFVMTVATWAQLLDAQGDVTVPRR